MRILAIETSCDETSAAIVEKNDSEKMVRVLSESTSTSLHEHALTGGIIPEKAARRQLEYMLPVVEDSLGKFSNKSPQQSIAQDIDAIAVTQGPGLIGSLLVGVECAKTLSYIFDKPLIPVNHLLAHLYANFIGENSKLKSQKIKKGSEQLHSTHHSRPAFPFIGLIVSGGHTDLLYFEDHDTYTWLGGTRDDAVGEALDKIGRRLGLSYPAGPEIETRAKKVSQSSVQFKSPLLHSQDYDFSYSGLKTEVVRYIDKEKPASEEEMNEICAAAQSAAFEVLVKKTVKVASDNNAGSILVGGGVAANDRLREMMEEEKRKNKLQTKLYFPEKKYTVDNAAMIGAWALFHPEGSDFFEIRATPEMYFS